MKTIERLDFPLRVYFRDGDHGCEVRHDSAVIVFTHGAPAYVRASGPFVIYPWEHIERIARVADKAQVSEQIAALEAEIVRLTTLHREKRLTLRDALGLRDDEAADNITGDFKALCERVASLRKNYESTYRVAHINADEAHRLSNAAANLKADLASVTEQRDVLKRQLEELRAEMRKPSLPQPKQAEPGGPIWVRVVDTTSRHFGLVGAINGIEYSSRDGREMWSVDLGYTGVSHQDASMFAVVGAGRQEHPSTPPNNAERQQAQNRDQWRATCLANGAKDCTVYFGPGEEVTFVVEMNQCTRKTISEIKEALMVEHCLPPTAYTIREVRPGVAGAVRKASEP